MNTIDRKTSRRFEISLLLILVSFILLFIISFKALRFQQLYLGQQSREKRLEQLDLISRDYFARLKTAPLTSQSISLPMEKPTFPNMTAPESSFARVAFFKLALASDTKLMLLNEAELNSPPEEQDFWQYLLANEYFSKANYFQARKIALRLLNSNFDFLMTSGKTLKTEAALLVAETFLRENNPEAFKNWIYSLRTLPAPAIVPRLPADLFTSKIPEDCQPWLRLLIFCYEVSYSANFQPGWVSENDFRVLILQHESGMVAFQADTIISSLHDRFVTSGFSDIKKSEFVSTGANSHLLADSNGLWIELKNSETSSIPGGFIVLLLLTSMGILGLFRFALYEWQFMQKRQLLDEEENFFRQTAHDLKTPMTIVRFLAETIALKRYKSEDQCSKYLQQLQNESERATELIDRLLLSVRLRKQTIAADLKSLSPVDCLKSNLLRFRDRLQDWEIIEQYETADSIIADPDMFNRVIINLVENIFRHASTGKKLLFKVCATENGQIAVMIGDKGPGLPAIADKGQKIDLLTGSLPYSSERGGSGNGLFLVKQILLTHAGLFYAEPAIGGGTWVVTTWKKAQ